MNPCGFCRAHVHTWEHHLRLIYWDSSLPGGPHPSPQRLGSPDSFPSSWPHPRAAVLPSGHLQICPRQGGVLPAPPPPSRLQAASLPCMLNSFHLGL